ncbi:MAG: sigma-70 family RNA polymerase sigma factor [Bdellovibrionales bacterium]|nr:sigma-70 family RNA polymerase sigma factor [Bdellovibrionales bacterium]
MQVADDSFGTGSVFLSDHNFESILNLALEWHQRFEDIDSRLSSLQNKFSLSDEFIQKKICKKSFLNSSSKDPELKIRDFAAEFNLVLIDIFELEKDTKLPFEVLKKILPEIKKLEIPMRELEKKVVAGNLRLVVNEAKKLRTKLGSWGQQLNINDLIQEGSFGLKKAVSRFDPGLKYKLSTFAVGWIKQSMRSSLCDQFGSVRLPNYVLLEISRLRREFQDRRNEDPDLSFSRFLEDLDKKPHTIRRIHSSFFAMNCKSIYPPVEESDRKHANLFGCDQKDTMSEAIRANLDKNFILEALSVPGLLTEIEKEVLNLRFGFSQAQELSYWEIGDLIGKSRTGAKYIEESALEKVKYYLLTNYSKHFLEN